MTSSTRTWKQPLATRLGVLIVLVMMSGIVVLVGGPRGLFVDYFPESVGVLVAVVVAVGLNVVVWCSSVRLEDDVLTITNGTRRHRLRLVDVLCLHPREWGTVIDTADGSRARRAWALPRQFTPKVTSMVSATDQACIDIALAARGVGVRVELVDVRLSDRWGAGWPADIEPPTVRYSDD